MDPLIEMVNRKTAERQHEAEKQQTKKNLAPIFFAVAVAMSCLLFTLVRLVHPGLGVPLMVIALMVGCYNLGLCVRFGVKAVR